MMPILLVVLSALFFLLLSACGGGGGSSPQPTPPAPPPVPKLPFSVGPGDPWAVTQGSNPRVLDVGQFDFLSCGRSQDGVDLCWDSYVEAPFAYSIASASKVTLKYEITGVDPVFSRASPGNNCPGPAALSLLLHRSGDMKLVNPSYRQFSSMSLATPLVLGGAIMSVSLAYGNWINVSGQDFGLSDVMANMASIGFVLGGGCFSGHGVQVLSGSARFKVGSLIVE